MAAASTASAQQDGWGARVSVARSDPSGCLTTGALRGAVERWLARSLRERELGALEVEVDASAEPGSFQVRRAGSVVAERRFDVLPERCADRIDAVSLAIALALDHLAGRRDGGPAAEAVSRPDASAGMDRSQPNAADPPTRPTAVPAAPIRAPEPPRAEPALAERDAAGARLRVHAAGALLAGVLPETAPVFGAGADLELGSLQLSVTLLASAVLDGALGAGRTETRLLALHARGCGLLPAAALALEGCAGLAGGAALARGSGYPSDMDATMGWLAPVLRVALRYPREGAVSLRVALDGAFNAVRPRLVLDGAPSTSSAGVLAGAAGIELSFGLP